MCTEPLLFSLNPTNIICLIICLCLLRTNFLADQELRDFTNNFNEQIGRGAQGRVFKGRIGPNTRGLQPQDVAVKVSQEHGAQERQSWEVSILVVALNSLFMFFPNLKSNSY